MDRIFKAKVFSAISIAIIAIFCACFIPNNANAAQFAFAKKLCIGSPASFADAAACQGEASVPQNTPVSYVFTTKNPLGEPHQNITLSDSYPSGFVASGGLVCTDQNGANVAVTPAGSAPILGSIFLPTNTTIICVAKGSFSTTGNKNNTAFAKNKDDTPYQTSGVWNTNVFAAPPLGVDLAVNKTSSGPIDISSGGDTINYTITITNNGPGTATLGNYFTLYDVLSLGPNSVPLNVNLASATCAASTGTDCLDPAGPNIVNPSSPTMVGTMGPHPFLSWGFANAGVIPQGGVITLTIQVIVEQLPLLECTQVLNGNSLVNKVFFSLSNGTSAVTEANNANNTSSVSTPVKTGQTTIDPTCGKGHIKITKTQVYPPPSSIVGWGTNVGYEIKIENFSIPPQPITIKKGDFQDLVTQGINTPRFMRTFIGAGCVSSTDPNVCTTMTSGTINDNGPHQYNYYTEANQAWLTNTPFTLQPGHNVTFKTVFRYEKPDCETVPNANPKDILNTGLVSYYASSYGATSASPQNTLFTAESTVNTHMKNTDPCKFVVRKALVPPANKLIFGNTYTYHVTYDNNGYDRHIGTILEAIRINIPNYANSLPFAVNWACNQSGGVTGFNASGSNNGFVVHTSTPAQGVQAANLGHNVYFPSGSSLDCKISIKVSPPAANDPNCTLDDAYLENLALMDTTDPFNPNINWPPSGTYNPAASSQPSPQVLNWATVKLKLPKCWKANVNKTASVPGLPSYSLPWTYQGNTLPINYDINLTNLGQSNTGASLGNPLPPPSIPQWYIQDSFNAPANNANAFGTPVICNPPINWCHTSGAPNNGNNVISIKSLGAGQTGTWNLQYNGPFTAGVPIVNCARIRPQFGALANDYYTLMLPPPTAPGCPPGFTTSATVPVIKLTKITVVKTVIDLTGSGGAANAGQFGVSIICNPYAIPISQNAFNLTTGTSGSSAPHVVNLVPVSSTCIVYETSSPIPPSIAQRCLGAANVLLQTNITQPPNPLNPTNNNVTITNTYSCKPPSGAVLNVKKVIVGPSIGGAQLIVPAQNYTFNSNCNPATSPTSINVNASGSANGTGSFNTAVNANCNVTENQPTFPPNFNPCGASGHPEWNLPIYSQAQPMIVPAGGANLTITNTWKCVPNATTGQIRIKKVTAGPPVFPPIGNQTFVFNANNANATPASVSVATAANGISPFSALITAPIGTSLTLSEITPAMPTTAQGCGAGAHPVWDPPSYSPALPIIVSAGITDVTVTNPWHCAPNTGGPAQIQIFKTLQRWNTSLLLPNMQFTINSNCTPNSTPTSVTLNTGTTGTVGGGAINTTVGTFCNFTETLPTTWPPAAINACGTTMHPVWNPPAYSIAQPMTASGMQNLMITNSWKCVPNAPSGTQLEILKSVTGPLPGAVIPPSAPIMAYNFGLSCNGAYSPSNVSINASGANSGSGMFNVAYNSSCTLSESLPPIPSVLNSYCAGIMPPGQIAVWDTPIQNPPNPIAIGTTIKTVNVTNRWKCITGSVPPPNPNSGGSSIIIEKQITGPINIANNLTFVLTANCTPSATQPRATITTNQNGVGTQTIIVPQGAQCTFSEVRPPLPASAQALCVGINGQIAQWNSAAAPNARVNAGQKLVLQDSWSCVAPGVNVGGVRIELPNLIPGIGRPRPKRPDPPTPTPDVPNNPGRP